MDLTPEQRERIYREEKQRLESVAADRAPAAGQGASLLHRPVPRFALVLVVLVGLLLVAVLWAMREGVEEAQKGQAESAKSDEAALSKLYAAPADPMSEQLQKISTDGGRSPDAIFANVQAVDEELTYAQLKKSPEKYAGRAWGFEGKILQIGETGDKTWARVGLDSWGNDVVWVEGDFTTEFVDGQRVALLGYLAGTHSYKSQAGWDIRIPALAARIMLTPRAADRLLVDVRIANKAYAGYERERAASLAKIEAAITRLDASDGREDAAPNDDYAGRVQANLRALGGVTQELADAMNEVKASPELRNDRAWREKFIQALAKITALSSDVLRIKPAAAFVKTHRAILLGYKHALIGGGLYQKGAIIGDSTLLEEAAGEFNKATEYISGVGQ